MMTSTIRKLLLLLLFVCLIDWFSYIIKHLDSIVVRISLIRCSIVFFSLVNSSSSSSSWPLIIVGSAPSIDCRFFISSLWSMLDWFSLFLIWYWFFLLKKRKKQKTIFLSFNFEKTVIFSLKNYVITLSRIPFRTFSLSSSIFLCFSFRRSSCSLLNWKKWKNVEKNEISQKKFKTKKNQRILIYETRGFILFNEQNIPTHHHREKKL